MATNPLLSSLFGTPPPPAAAAPLSAASSAKTARSVSPYEENEEVRALAAKLAPALEEADALFSHLPDEFRRQSTDEDRLARGGDDDDGDSIDEEIRALQLSEPLLRQELDMASDFSNFFRSPQQDSAAMGNDDDDGGGGGGSEIEVIDEGDKGEDDSNNNNNTQQQQYDDAAAAMHLVTLSDSGESPSSGAAEADIRPFDQQREEEALEEEEQQQQPSAGAFDPTTPGSERSNRSRRSAQLAPIPIPQSTPTTATSGTPRSQSRPHTPDLDQLLFVSPSSTTGRQANNGALPQSYTTSDHAARAGLRLEDSTWYSLDLSRDLIRTTTMGFAAPNDDDNEEAHCREYCLTLADNKLKSLCLGLQEVQHHQPSQQTQQSSSLLPPETNETGTITATVTASAPPASSSSYSTPPKSKTRTPSSSSSAPLSRKKTPSTPSSGNNRKSASPSKRAQEAQQQHLLPVRTVSIRIRPDALCGAVMDAVQHSLETGHENDMTNLDVIRIVKRQGGHLQASVEPHFSASQQETEGDGDVSTATVEPAAVPFFLDAQLCTYKSDLCERILLVRVYHHPSSVASAATGTLRSPTAATETTPRSAARSTPNSSNNNDDDPDSFQIVSNLDPGRDRAAAALASSNHLREACALIQRMESPQTAKRIRISSSSSSPGRQSTVRTLSDVQQAVSQHLLTHYRACPSVLNGGLTLPSLNSIDWPVVQSCWSTVSALYHELESRDLTYSSLCWSRFGSFPALPTLDVHYCSQLRQLSRQDMIVQLLKSASELEEYARKAEYACANMISLLQPTFETYGVDAPSLPKATPLTSYPLDFVAPQQACPPWGQAVLEALNEIQAWTGTKNGEDAAKNADDPLGMLGLGGNAEERAAACRQDSEAAQESLGMADKSVQLVLKAFQRQYDEEKGARLGRKNAQVMDRLAKMQQHEHLTIMALDRSYQHSEKAAKAAQDFESKSGGILQVPLLKWSIVVGGSTGTCWVTSNQIMFVTQLIPLLGGSTTTMFKLQDVEFSVVQEGVPSLLNPLPTVISITQIQDGTQVYSFRPSSGGTRLKSFLEIVQRTNLEDPVVAGDFLSNTATAGHV